MKTFSNKTNRYIIVTVLIFVCLVSYGRILSNDFINFDDNVYLTENNHIRSGLNLEMVRWAFTTVVSSNWHPVTLLSHALDWSLFGDKAGGHHFVNLLLHICSVLLLFLFLNKTTRSLWPSALAAALFALHPLRVESVAWAAERKDVLSMFFGLGTIYAYSFYVEQRQTSKYILCLILFILGLMSKPMLVTLPFVMLLLDYWPFARWKKEIKPVTNAPKIVPVKKKDKQQRLQPVKQNVSVTPKGQTSISQLLWEKVPFFILAVLSSIVTVWAQRTGGALVSLEKLSFAERFMNAIVSYIVYLKKTFWPVDLAIFYPYQQALPFWQFLIALLLLLLISILAIIYIRKLPFLFVGWFWYVGTLIPVIGLVQVGRQAMADRYTYLPSIGLGIILVWGLMSLLPQEKLQKIILLPIAVITIILLMTLTWRQCGYWKNSIILFTHTINVTTDNYLAYTNLGVALAAQGSTEEAIQNYHKALAIKPHDDSANYNLANALKRQNKIDEAAKHYSEAIRSNPYYANAHNNLGLILTDQKKYDDAIYHYRQAIALKPNNAGFYLNLGFALAKKGNVTEAIQCFRTAIILNPYYDDARRALHMALEIEKKHNSLYQR